MTTGGQLLLQTGQAGPQPFAAVPRPLVGFARNYPAGWYNRQHTHPWAQVIYAVAGVMRIETRSAAYVVPPSTALFLPADVPHAVRMDGPVAMRALFLREDAAARSPAQAGVISVSPLLREVILAACSEPLRWDLRGRGRHLTALALDEITHAAPLPLSLPMPRDARLQRVVSVILDQPGTGRSLEDFARVAGASSRTLARLFRSETGVSFRQWRQQVRLTEALSALSTGASLAQAAQLAGYTTQPAFGVAFRAVFGMTPGQARQRKQTIQESRV